MNPVEIAKYLIKYLLDNSMSDAVAAFVTAHPGTDSDTLEDALILARMQIMGAGVLS
jgi:hypothetical protein